MPAPPQATGPAAPAPSPGRLLLVPNTLDLGLDVAAALPIADALPAGVLQVAAGLRHWVVENAKSARAFLKRVHAMVPLVEPLQALQITELPRAPKGGGGVAPDIAPLLAPLRAGHDVGLLSEAGLPAVADPGSALVLAAHAEGIPVRPLAGASALTLALAASGLDGQRFAFWGYLPNDADGRARRLRELEAQSRQWQQTQLFIETPYRNATLLAALLATLAPATWLSVSCGLTLPHGFTRTDRVRAWRERPLQLPGDTPAVFALLAR